MGGGRRGITLLGPCTSASIELRCPRFRAALCKLGPEKGFIILIVSFQNLTGGCDKGGVHVTDVTNASRTMLMNIKTLSWDTYLCK